MDFINQVDKKKFDLLFSTSDLCLKALAKAKWKYGYRCKKCGHDNYCDGKSPWSRRCTRCKFDESATANTLFHKCKIPIEKAFQLVWLTCNNPTQPVSVLSEKAGLRKMTCWRMRKMIRQCQRGKENLSIQDFIPERKQSIN